VTSRVRVTAGVGAIFAAALGIAMMWPSRPRPGTDLTAPAPPSEGDTTAPASGETTNIDDVARAGDEPDLLVVARGDDAPDLRERGLATIALALHEDVTTAVTRIAATDLRSDGYVAARAIRALSRLSARASDADRARIGERLASWLAAERRRETPDALGNVSILAEELGRVRHPSSAKALVEALDAADLPLHVESRIVTSLGELADPLGAAAVERFDARVPAPAGTDAFEDAIRREAKTIAATARDRISRG
jgi:hypothetical protein